MRTINCRSFLRFDGGAAAADSLPGGVIEIVCVFGNDAAIPWNSSELPAPLAHRNVMRWSRRHINVRLVATWITVADTDNITGALNGKADLVIGHRHHSALGVGRGNGEDADVLAVGVN